MVTEVLTEYGPVNRFWFDGTSSNPCKAKSGPGSVTDLWQQIYNTIRSAPWQHPTTLPPYHPGTALVYCPSVLT